MNEAALEDTLQALLEGDPMENLFEEVGINSVHTFNDAGVMTRNKGLVLVMADGTEFQLTIVQSKRSQV